MSLIQVERGAREGRVLARLHVELDGRAVERRAVVERDAVADVEGPLGVVGVVLVRLDEHRGDLAVLGGREQRVRQRREQHVAGRRVARLVRREEVRGVGLDAVDEVAALDGLTLVLRHVALAGRRARGRAAVVALVGRLGGIRRVGRVRGVGLRRRIRGRRRFGVGRHGGVGDRRRVAGARIVVVVAATRRCCEREGGQHGEHPQSALVSLHASPCWFRATLVGPAAMSGRSCRLRTGSQSQVTKFT